MIKVIETLKEDEEYKKYLSNFRTATALLVANIHQIIDDFTQTFQAEYTNLDEVKNEISELVKVKLTIKVPDTFIENALVLNSEKESKKVGRKRKK